MPRRTSATIRTEKIAYTKRFMRIIYIVTRTQCPADYYKNKSAPRIIIFPFDLFPGRT